MPSTAQALRLGAAYRHDHRSTVEPMRRASRCSLVVLVACAAATAATAAGPAALEPKLTKALTAPSLSLGRTAALAVDLSTGTVVFAHNESLPVAPASNEKIPVSWAALTRLGAGVPLPHGGVRRRRPGRRDLGRRSRPEGIRRPDALDRRPRPPRGDDPRARDPLGDRPGARRRVVLRHGSAAPRAGSRTSSAARRPRCRPSSSTGRRAGPRSRRRSSPPARSATRSSAAASRSRAGPGLGVAPAGGGRRSPPTSPTRSPRSCGG